MDSTNVLFNAIPFCSGVIGTVNCDDYPPFQPIELIGDMLQFFTCAFYFINMLIYPEVTSVVIGKSEEVFGSSS